MFSAPPVQEWPLQPDSPPACDGVEADRGGTDALEHLQHPFLRAKTVLICGTSYAGEIKKSIFP